MHQHFFPNSSSINVQVWFPAALGSKQISFFKLMSVSNPPSRLKPVDELQSCFAQRSSDDLRGTGFGVLPSGDSSGGLRQVQSRILSDLDGLPHGGQQTLASLSPQGRAETLRASDQQLHHHVGVLLHALAWCTDPAGKGRGMIKSSVKGRSEVQGRKQGHGAKCFLSACFQ